MNVYMTKNGQQRTLTRNNFEADTSMKAPYYTNKPVQYAICPYCSNPIEIRELYPSSLNSRPYARHYKHSITDLANYDYKSMRNCIYYKNWTEKEVAFTLTCGSHSPFYIRHHIVITNVSWGADFAHEIDLLSISKSGYGTEVEIKVSVSDLKRDMQKDHAHCDKRIKELYFAGPAEMEEALFQYAPEKAGIILVERVAHDKTTTHRCHTIRKPQSNKDAIKFSEKEIVNLLRLGNMRFWTLLGNEFKHPKED